MSRSIKRRVDEHRAAVLLGMAKADLRHYSQLSGLGQVETDAQGPKMVFTYEELHRICLLATQSSKAA